MSTPCEKQGLISLASRIADNTSGRRAAKSSETSKRFYSHQSPRYEKKLSGVAGRRIINLLQSAVRFSHFSGRNRRTNDFYDNRKKFLSLSRRRLKILIQI